MFRQVIKANIGQGYSNTNGRTEVEVSLLQLMNKLIIMYNNNYV